MTDFGLQDPYVGIMKGVIKTIFPSAEIIDLTHDIPPQNILVAHFILRHSFEHFPDKTVFVSVVDPGVGTERKAIAIALGKYYFVGPDNGLFGFLHDERFKGIQVIHLTKNHYFYKKKPDQTFHGRDIFAPVAAHIDKGAVFSELGSHADGFEYLHTPESIEKGREIEVPLLHIDGFGNMIFSMTREKFEGKVGTAPFSIHLGSHTIKKISKHYDEHEVLVALFNSYGLLEIAAPLNSAAKCLGISGNDKALSVRMRLKIGS
jgi:hypothetical protein